MSEAANGNTTTLEGSPILDEQAPEPPKHGRGVFTFAIGLERDQQGFDLKLREPGIVRGCAIMLKEPQVLMAGMRGVPPIVCPVLFVESDPDREERVHTFMWVPSDAVIRLKAGAQAQWRATATMETETQGRRGVHVRHLFELVEVQP